MTVEAIISDRTGLNLNRLSNRGMLSLGMSVTPDLIPQPHGGALRRGNPGRKGPKPKPAISTELLAIVERDSKLELPSGAITSRLRALGRAEVEVALPYIGRIARNETRKGEEPATKKESIAAFAVLVRASIGEVNGVLLENDEVLRVFAGIMGRQIMGALQAAAMLTTEEERTQVGIQFYQAGIIELKSTMDEMGK